MKTTTSMCATAVVCAALYVQTTISLGDNDDSPQRYVTHGTFVVSASNAPVTYSDSTQPTEISVTRPEFSQLIDSAANEAAEDGWDGPGTFAVDAKTRVRAHLVASMLPAELPEPDVSVTPSGSISFDWYKGAESLFSIMVPRTGGVSFAAYFSGDRLNGAMNLVADRLPSEIVAAAERWIAA